jgi:drug/metabolite transporter (DMT)-like permease
LSALIFSMLILNEPLKWNIVFGGSLSIIAVFLINSAKKSS